MDDIRNFSIIAHIDHGKTTLTDAFLKLTKTVSQQQFQERMMDSNPIEREKGVTIKLAPVRMKYQEYILNLIDTPGHVDFGYEVNRSLAACEGAILLIDASQGVQAQTLANFQKAKQVNLKIIPVINKIDLASADVEQTILECMETFGFDEDEFLLCSAKTGEGVREILDAIVERIPAPTTQLVIDQQDSSKKTSRKVVGQNSEKNACRALIFSSIFDNHLGAVAYIRVVNGAISRKNLFLMFSQTAFTPVELGFFTPNRQPNDCLKAGEVGYVATGLKNIKLLKIGDTITDYEYGEKVKPLPGFKEPTPMVFMELYPVDNADFHLLEDAMSKLAIHDSALLYNNTHSQALGNGLRVGFLGIFHAEIIRERLKREFNLNLIATAPSVIYKILLNNGQEKMINNPAEMPDPTLIKKIKEPYAKLTIFTPEQYLSSIIKFVRKKRGKLINSTSSANRNLVEYQIPLAELISNFHDELKSLSSGFASMEYALSTYQAVDAVKVNILINKELIEALSFITVREKAENRARALVKKLKEVVPKQLFEIPIQAAIGGKIIARETIKAYRKDVTAKLYGGDRTRRMKLLKKQAEGKKRMKQFGRVELNQEAFLAVLES
ncbi:MAG: translation elongation factor 4 [Candidatus Woesebacteria bacterium]|jgi:GTP-binding protein LepA